MPGFIAKKLCPDLIFVKNNSKRNKEISDIFKSVLAEYDPNQESMGLDESNLDVTDYLIEHDMNNDEGREKLVQEIRRKVNDQTQLTCSAGVGCNRMLAKIGSDMNKPNGHFILKNGAEMIKEFMAELGIRKVPSVGRVAESELNELGVYKCRDVFDRLTEIYLGFGERSTEFFIKAALGISRNEHEDDDSGGLKKSISISETFKPIKEKHEFEMKIEQLAEGLERKLKQEITMGKTVTLGFTDTKYEYREK